MYIREGLAAPENPRGFGISVALDRVVSYSADSLDRLNWDGSPGPAPRKERSMWGNVERQVFFPIHQINLNQEGR